MLDSFDWLDQVQPKPFAYTAPQEGIDCRYVEAVIHEEYAPRVAELIARLNPKRYLAIGGLFGTTESYALQNCGWRPEKIVVIDIDSPEYNPNRDSGSHLYKNICGTMFGGFDGDFSFHRMDSQKIIGGKIGCNSVMQFDLAFVDAEHTAEAVYRDIANASLWLSLGGTILVHDIELIGSTVCDGYAKWLLDNPNWKHVEIPNEKILHGMGVIWSAE